MVDLAGNRTPSIEQSCLTETTDCPSDVSVITSISALPRLHPNNSSVSPLNSSSTNREDSLAARLGHPREDEGIQRAEGRRSKRRGPSPPQHFLPPTQLRALVRDRLQAEGINLSSHPYTQSVSSFSMSCKVILGGLEPCQQPFVFSQWETNLQLETQIHLEMKAMQRRITNNPLQRRHNYTGVQEILIE